MVEVSRDLFDTTNIGEQFSQLNFENVPETETDAETAKLIGSAK